MGLQIVQAGYVVSAVVSHSMMRQQELKPQTRAWNGRTESKPMMKRVVPPVLSMQVRQGLTLDRRQGLQNVQAGYQVQTMLESQMQTKALNEMKESQQKVRTWKLTQRERQVAELQVMLQVAEQVVF